MKLVGSFATALFALCANAQSAELPVREWVGEAQDPLVLYLSGDGGFNSFSTELCNTINKTGYSVTAVNSRSYFWDKKTPEQSAKDLSTYLDKKFLGRKSQELVLIGYSFGADVLPFIVDRMTEATKSKVASIILLSPSSKANFEIHLSGLLGFGTKDGLDVVAEINKIGPTKLVTISGDDELDFPAKQIKLKNYDHVVLPGGHHYDREIETVAKTMVKHFE